MDSSQLVPSWQGNNRQQPSGDKENLYNAPIEGSQNASKSTNSTNPQHSTVIDKQTNDFSESVDDINIPLEPVSGRKDCVNPVAWTLMNDGIEQWDYLVIRDNSPKVIRPTPVRPNHDSAT